VSVEGSIMEVFVIAIATHAGTLTDMARVCFTPLCTLCLHSLVFLATLSDDTIRFLAGAAPGTFTDTATSVTAAEVRLLFRLACTAVIAQYIQPTFLTATALSTMQHMLI